MTDPEEFVRAAHAAGYDVGTTRGGKRLHAVDFNTDSLLAKAHDQPDRLACGAMSDCRHAEQDDADGVCGNCVTELGIRKAIADGGRVRRCGAADCSAAADVVTEDGDRCLSCADQERELVTDGGRDQDDGEVVHVDEHGLWIPPRFREFDQQLVIRTPRATIQHFGSNPTDPYYGLVDASHFGSVEELRDARNPDLAPDKISLKPQGEDPVIFEVEDVA